MISMDRQMAIEVIKNTKNTILGLKEMIQNLKEEYKITEMDLMEVD